MNEQQLAKQSFELPVKSGFEKLRISPFSLAGGIRVKGVAG
jgi:hypothetical protein